MPMRYRYVVALLVLMGLGVAGYYFSIPQGAAVPQPLPFNFSQILFGNKMPVGWKEYQSAEHGFSLFYPGTLTVNEIDEGGGALTIVFQNPQEGKGFQIFMVPHPNSQISEDRFQKDLPLGARTNEEPITIEGVPGVSFYSNNPLLGEMREVWFLHDGMLFEVSTLKVLEADLLEILKTWRFMERGNS